MTSWLYTQVKKGPSDEYPLIQQVHNPERILRGDLEELGVELHLVGSDRIFDAEQFRLRLGDRQQEFEDKYFPKPKE